MNQEYVYDQMPIFCETELEAEAEFAMEEEQPMMEQEDDAICKPYIEFGSENEYPPQWLYGDGFPYDCYLKNYKQPNFPLVSQIIYPDITDIRLEGFSGTDCVVTYNTLFWIIIIVLVLLAILYSQKLL